MIPSAAVLPDKDPTESVVVQFDFDAELSAIDSVVMAATTEAGVDATPLAILDGAAQIQGTSVLQRISAGVDQANYKLRCEATHGDDVRVLTAILPVRAA